MYFACTARFIVRYSGRKHWILAQKKKVHIYLGTLINAGPVYISLTIHSHTFPYDQEFKHIYIRCSREALKYAHAQGPQVNKLDSTASPLWYFERSFNFVLFRSRLREL